MADRKLQILITAKDEASKALKGLSGVLQNNQKAFQNMAKYGAVAFGAMSAGIGKMVSDASQFESIGMSFQRTAGMYGSSVSDMLASLNEASAGTISNTDLMLSANKAMALGVGSNTEELSKLLEIARMKGRALGLDTTQAFNDMVTGIGRGSPLILDNLGIITKGWAEEAEATGQAMNAQFIMNKILADGTKELEAMGEILPTPTEQFQQMKKKLSDLSTQIGQIFLPIILKAVDSIGKIIDVFAKWANEHQKLIKVITIVITSISGILAVVGTLGLILPTIIKGFGFLKTAISGVTTALKFLIANPIVAVLALIAMGVVYLSNRFGGLQNALKVVCNAFAIMGNILSLGFKGIANTIINVINWALEKGNKVYNWFVDTINKLGGHMERNEDAMSINFQFDEDKNINNIETMLQQMTDMRASVKAGQEQSNAEMNELYGADLDNFSAMVDGKGASAGNLKEAYKDLGDTFKKTMEETQSAMEETSKKIAEIQTKLSDLLVKRAEDELGMKQSYAQAYVDQEQRVAELQAQWQKETDQEKKNSLLSEYEYQLSLLQQKKNIEMVYQNEINEIRRRNSLSDFERQLEDLDNKRTLMDLEFEAEHTKIQNELKAEEEKQKVLAELNAWALAEADKALALGEKQTSDSINRQISYYNKLAEAVKNAKEGKYTSYTSLAQGRSQVMSSKNEKPSLNIVINGDVSGQELVDKVSEQLMGSLRLNGQVQI